MYHNQESKGFLEKYMGKIKNAVIGTVLTAYLTTTSGCSIAWRDPITPLRITYKQNSTIGDNIQTPESMTEYSKQIEMVRTERMDLAKKLALMDSKDPSKVDYTALEQRAKKMIDSNLGLKFKPYSLEELQVVHTLMAEAKDQDVSSFIASGLENLEEGIQRKLVEYHVALAGNKSTSREDKGKNYLSAMALARGIGDRALFDRIYNLQSENLEPVEIEVDGKKVKTMFPESESDFAASYPDEFERMRQGIKSDNRARNFWWGFILISAGLYAQDQNDDDSSSGPASGGDDGSGGPGGL